MSLEAALVLDIAFLVVSIVVPLIPIFLLSRLLIVLAREFLSPLQSVLLGNGLAFALILIIGAFALSTDGTPQWTRSASLFLIYAVVIVIDIARLLAKRWTPRDAELLPSLPPSYQRSLRPNQPRR